MDKLTILTCWWTIDKDYWVWKWIYDVEPGNPVVGEILKKNKVNYNFDLIEVLRKDSLDMTDEDRQKIKEVLEKVDNNKILITHGTDTMIETWKVLWDIKDKLIVLVWAARPYAMKDSDAEFNVAYALWVLDILSQIKKKWVYVAMNWQYFNVKEVEKWEDGVFRKK